MEKKQRVPKGEKLWFIDYFGDITHIYEDYGAFVTNLYDAGNYFHTEEEAESMITKLRAVLKGANVIEMPSEEELEHKATDIAMERKDEFFDEAGELVLCFGECYDAAADMVKFLKSKIVK